MCVCGVGWGGVGGGDGGSQTPTLRRYLCSAGRELSAHASRHCRWTTLLNALGVMAPGGPQSPPPLLTAAGYTVPIAPSLWNTATGRSHFPGGPASVTQQRLEGTEVWPSGPQRRVRLQPDSCSAREERRGQSSG